MGRGQRTGKVLSSVAQARLDESVAEVTSSPIIDDNGTELWKQNGLPHRVDGPAIIRVDGAREWFIKGDRHREGGPAIEHVDGSKAWFLNGQRHREGGPAYEGSGGGKSWFINGQRHRVDGPAIERADGSKEWWIKGKRHREDGPAIEATAQSAHANDNGTYWLRGEKLSYSKWLAKTSKPKFEVRGSLAESLLGVRKSAN